MSQRGLTLLEMMVVLLIASMAVTLAFQSLQQWQRTNATIASIGSANQQTLLTESWIEASLRGLTPVEDAPFKGDASQIVGVSIQPVQLQQGSTTPTTWTIRKTNTACFLDLTEGRLPTLALPLAETERATFVYLDTAGNSYDQWPPQSGLHEQLPALIALKLTTFDGQERIWAATIVGTRKPLQVQFEDTIE